MAALAEQRPGVHRRLGSEHADLPGEPQGVLHLVGEWHSATIRVFWRTKAGDCSRG